jgi:hypothetical protein
MTPSTLASQMAGPRWGTPPWWGYHAHYAPSAWQGYDPRLEVDVWYAWVYHPTKYQDGPTYHTLCRQLGIPPLLEVSE